MPKQKLTLTLDSDNVNELRTIVGARSISAAIDAAVTAYLERQRHLRAVDEWLAEMEKEYGPIPARDMKWAKKVIDGWATKRDAGRRSAAV